VRTINGDGMTILPEQNVRQALTLAPGCRARVRPSGADWSGTGAGGDDRLKRAYLGL
jgi:hypothetical protein